MHTSPTAFSARGRSPSSTQCSRRARTQGSARSHSARPVPPWRRSARRRRASNAAAPRSPNTPRGSGHSRPGSRPWAATDRAAITAPPDTPSADAFAPSETTGAPRARPPAPLPRQLWWRSGAGAARAGGLVERPEAESVLFGHEFDALWALTEGPSRRNRCPPRVATIRAGSFVSHEGDTSARDRVRADAIPVASVMAPTAQVRDPRFAAPQLGS